MTPLDLAENPLPDDPEDPFTPQREHGDATDEEVVAVLRELMQEAGLQSAVASPGSPQ